MTLCTETFRGAWGTRRGRSTWRRRTRRQRLHLRGVCVTLGTTCNFMVEQHGRPRHTLVSTTTAVHTLFVRQNHPARHSYSHDQLSPILQPVTAGCCRNIGAMLTAGQSQALSGRAKQFAGRQLATANGGRVSSRQPQRLLVQARAKEAGVGIFGTKAGMTQIFTRDGLALPATVIALEEGNIVTQVCARIAL